MNQTPPAPPSTGTPPSPPPPPMPPTQPSYQTTPPPSPTNYEPPQQPQSNGMAIASLIIGIFALVLSWSMVFGIILGVLAVIFGFLGKKKATTDLSVGGRGLAITGLVLGFTGIAIALLIIIFFVVLATTAFSFIPFELMRNY